MISTSAILRMRRAPLAVAASRACARASSRISRLRSHLLLRFSFRLWSLVDIDGSPKVARRADIPTEACPLIDLLIEERLPPIHRIIGLLALS
jgi:hypothetical protein